MNNATFSKTENGIEMNRTIRINFCNKKLNGISRANRNNYVIDLIGTYAPILIASLERRMQACEQNLVNHLDSIEYADEDGFIIYVRKDGTYGSFNIPSFIAMKNVVKALQQGQFRAFFSQKLWIDQTLKALLNDTEQHHEDKMGFKYSELVSLLCELHTN